MKLRDGFYLKKADGINTIVSDSKNSPLNNSIVLSETSVFLFNQLCSGEKSKELLLKLLLDNFDISTVLALNDIDIFVKTLKQNGIIEE